MDSRKYFFYSIHGHDEIIQPFYQAMDDSNTVSALEYINNPLLQTAQIMHYPLSIAISKGQRELVDAILEANGSLTEKLDTGKRNQYYMNSTPLREIACGQGYPELTACDFAVLELLQKKLIQPSLHQLILSNFEYVLSKDAKITIADAYYHLLRRFSAQDPLVMRLKAGLLETLYNSETDKVYVEKILNNEPEILAYVSRNDSSIPSNSTSSSVEEWVGKVGNIMRQYKIFPDDRSNALSDATENNPAQAIRIANNSSAFKYAQSRNSRPSSEVVVENESIFKRWCSIL